MSEVPFAQRCPPAKPLAEYVRCTPIETKPLQQPTPAAGTL
ncbi:hypothetical protein [Thiorhodococcus fuscus]|uniref:Uncharacterized protein n=1 Tax=Thiorhodococcus fuscus TaxID=527200 RepID=A0ABW4Y8E6_9GAMM